MKVVYQKRGQDWVLLPRPLVLIKGITLKDKNIISYHRAMHSRCFCMESKVCMLLGTKMKEKLQRVSKLK